MECAANERDMQSHWMCELTNKERKERGGLESAWPYETGGSREILNKMIIAESCPG